MTRFNELQPGRVYRVTGGFAMHLSAEMSGVWKEIGIVRPQECFLVLGVSESDHTQYVHMLGPRGVGYPGCDVKLTGHNSFEEAAAT